MGCQKQFGWREWKGLNIHVLSFPICGHRGQQNRNRDYDSWRENRSLTLAQPPAGAGEGEGAGEGAGEEAGVGTGAGEGEGKGEGEEV